MEESLMACMKTAASFLFAIAPLAAFAQAPTYPAAPIKIVVPYPPGGGNDIPARIIGEEMRKLWGQPVIVENRAGASATMRGSGRALAGRRLHAAAHKCRACRGARGDPEALV
jgi:tripartite-type tricarboxylate transporter receptor subunit TctC